MIRANGGKKGTEEQESTAWAALLSCSIISLANTGYHISSQQTPEAHAALVLTNGGVVYVIVGSNHAQIQRRHIHLILNADALGLLQVTKGLFHQL